METTYTTTSGTLVQDLRYLGLGMIITHPESVRPLRDNTVSWSRNDGFYVSIPSRQLMHSDDIVTYMQQLNLLYNDVINLTERFI